MAFGATTDFAREVWLASFVFLLLYLTQVEFCDRKIFKDAKWLAMDTILISMLVICQCP